MANSTCKTRVDISVCALDAPPSVFIPGTIKILQTGLRISTASAQYFLPLDTPYIIAANNLLNTCEISLDHSVLFRDEIQDIWVKFANSVKWLTSLRICKAIYLERIGNRHA